MRNQGPDCALWQPVMRNQGRNMIKHSKKSPYEVMGLELALKVKRGKKRSLLGGKIRNREKIEGQKWYFQGTVTEPAYYSYEFVCSCTLLDSF